MGYQLVPRADHLPRASSRELTAIRLSAVGAAEQASCAAYITEVLLHHTARLSNIEAQLIQQYPIGEPRFRMLVDAYVGVGYAILSGQARP